MSDKHNTSTAFSWLNPVHVLAFGLGAGKIPHAPGTFGSLLAIPLFILLQHFPLWQYLAFVFLFTLAGIVLCHITARDLGVHDHPGIVIDEVAGMLVSYIMLPSGWGWMVLGFALFRLFDIWKPFPIGLCDKKVSGGFGIMLDDIIAGLYALVILQVCHILWTTLL